MKLTKETIETLVNEIIEYLEKNDMLQDICIYFNNKRICFGSQWNEEKEIFLPLKKVEENVNPFHYFKYANAKHIISMSFEGGLYHLLNDGMDKEESFSALFDKYGLYYELGNAWNLSVYPVSESLYEEIEYTSYEEPQEPEHIYLNKEDVPEPLKKVMEIWYSLSATVGDKGTCALGAGFQFTYNGKLYFLSSCSPFQGSLSWEKYKDIIQTILELIGATNITYDYGRMD